MSNRLSLGPVQVVENSVISINDALRQIQNRLDEMKGLRGRSLTFDRIKVRSEERRVGKECRL